jgi:hypothetical protein
MDEYLAWLADFRPSSFEAEAWGTSALMAPVSFNFAVWEYWAQFSEQWWKNVFAPAHHCEHEHNCQLEVPDPIQAEDEHDLFA